MGEIIGDMSHVTHITPDSATGHTQLARDVDEQARAGGVDLVGPRGLLTGA